MLFLGCGSSISGYVNAPTHKLETFTKTKIVQIFCISHLFIYLLVSITYLSECAIIIYHNCFYVTSSFFLVILRLVPLQLTRIFSDQVIIINNHRNITRTYEFVLHIVYLNLLYCTVYRKLGTSLVSYPADILGVRFA